MPVDPHASSHGLNRDSAVDESGLEQRVEPPEAGRGGGHRNLQHGSKTV